MNFKTLMMTLTCALVVLLADRAEGAPTCDVPSKREKRRILREVARNENALSGAEANDRFINGVAAFSGRGDNGKVPVCGMTQGQTPIDLARRHLFPGSLITHACTQDVYSESCTGGRIRCRNVSIPVVRLQWLSGCREDGHRNYAVVKEQLIIGCTAMTEHFRNN